MKPVVKHTKYIIYNKNTGDVCNKTLSDTAHDAMDSIDYENETEFWVKKIEFSINLN